MKESGNRSIRISYYNAFWLFMAGSLLGVVFEGVNRLALKGQWETHVLTIWGPFCTIYGLGMVGYYVGYKFLKDKNVLIQFLIFAIIGSTVEYLCGWLLKYGLQMGAWDYSGSFLNIQGILSPSMMLVWGVAGVLFCKGYPYIDKIFVKMKGLGWRIAAIILTVFMIVNSIVTAACIVRWKNRHDGLPAANRVEQRLDERYPDDYMQRRFCEWFFLDERESK
ncbi:MAG TPA: putative ABC transporter permease [Lachnospiraceae bacterium]|nr:putative ABC transporter permease [Lachnospiraceae bacterium]